MRLTRRELEYLATWAREESEPACYQLPAHRLQLSHGVPGASLIRMIKSWTETEHKKDHEILDAAEANDAVWPWASAEDFRLRLETVNDSGGPTTALAAKT